MPMSAHDVTARRRGYSGTAPHVAGLIGALFTRPSVLPMREIGSVQEGVPAGGQNQDGPRLILKVSAQSS